MPFAGKSPDPHPFVPFIVNFYFLVRALEISVLYNLRSGIKTYNAQSSVPNLQAFQDCLAFWLVMPFLSNPLKALVTGFPSVTSVLQHLVFKISFHVVHFTAPSPSPGCDEKVILIFQRSPVNYSTGLCIAYSLQYSAAREATTMRKPRATSKEQPSTHRNQRKARTARKTQHSQK